MDATIVTQAGPLRVIALQGGTNGGQTEPVALLQESKRKKSPDGKPVPQTIYLTRNEVELLQDLLKHAVKELK